MLRQFALGLSLASLLAVQAGAAPVDTFVTDRKYPPKLPDAKVETYKTVGDKKLAMYIFEPADLKPSDKRPAIVFFFGGGWQNGSASQFAAQARYLASRGMVAFAADYRVGSRDGVKAVTCLTDAKSAIRWVRENAARLGVDPNRVVASGGSAGGHLAAALGTIDEFDEPTESLSISSKPNVMVLYNPAVALARFEGMKADPEREAAMPNRAGTDPVRLSPIHHLKKSTPPSLVLIGTADGLYPQCQLFAVECERLGVRCDMDVWDDKPHGFFNATGTREKNEAFRKTTETVDRFLASLGYLQDEPTVETFDNWDGAK